MAPQRHAPDQFGRPALATRTCPISVTPATPNTGSLWPTHTGSDWPALDSLGAGQCPGLSQRALTGLPCAGKEDHRSVCQRSVECR